MSRDTEYVLRTVREREVRFVRLWFVDVLGLLKSVAIPSSELESALADGVGIDGSSLEGQARLRERDVIARPDPGTFHVLRRTVTQAADLGYTFQVGPEIEFFLFGQPTDGAEPAPLDDGAYFDLTSLDMGSDFRRRTIDYLEQMGIPVKASHHEVAASQHELDLRHTDGLSMADALTTFRLCVKEVARELEMHATFMPKPVESLAGSGMHLHLSLFAGDRNAFYSPDLGEPLSPVGRAFLAGILAHAPELTAATNQWVNSYKRLASGFEAPQRIGWTRQGDPTLIRVPSNRPGKEEAARIEIRSPDPGCNPYLAFALLLAAGLRGIERGYELPPESTGQQNGLPRLPQDLREATTAFESSDLVRETLGDHICDWYVRNKRRDWDAFHATVTEFERRQLLRLL
jgi:glutamine synthetase